MFIGAMGNQLNSLPFGILLENSYFFLDIIYFILSAKNNCFLRWGQTTLIAVVKSS